MRRSAFLFTFLVAMFCSMLNIRSVSASSNCNDNCYPVARVVLTPVFLCDDAAFSFLAEGGPRSYRFNGTLGAIWCEQHRFKVGGEYLAQRVKYSFDTGRVHRWMHQWAVGGRYEYLFADDCYCDWLNGFEISGYYAKANSKDLSVEEENSESEFRRISGGRTWNVELGTTFDTWNCGYILVAIDYDSVEYKRRFQSDKTVKGVGATVELYQPLWCDFVFDFKYQYKRAYDYIEALLDWRNNLECGDINIGIFANHVFGKERLPSSTTVGIELGFSFGIDNLFDGCCYDPCASNCCVMDCNDLAAWVSRPAVYMPQVLAITDQDDCSGPSLVGSIPDQTFNVGENVFIDLNEFFNTQEGSHIHFNVNGLPSGISVNSHGIISGLVTQGIVESYTISVTADNDCGQASTTFTLNLQSGA